MSAEMIARYRNLVEGGSDNFRGFGICQYGPQIKRLIQKTGSKTVLDFGCGAGEQYTLQHLDEFWGVARPTLYDPAFASHDKLPEGKFDAVLASDVMEHVPLEEIEGLILQLFGYANKFVWASICCRTAKKVFDDGLNMHVTIQPFWWWQAKFAKLSKGIPHVVVETR